MLSPAETRNSRPDVSLGQSSEDQMSSSLLACVIVTTADSGPRSILQSLAEEFLATSWKVGVSSGAYEFWTLRRLNWTMPGCSWAGWNRPEGCRRCLRCR